MSSSSRQIKAGAVISYIALAINILASLIYLPWMVGMIGKSNYALYTLASSFIALFMLDFGLSSTVSRFVAKYNAEGRTDAINEVISTVMWLYIIIDAIIFTVLGVLYFFVGRIYSGLTVEEIHVFKQLYLIVALYSIVSFPFLPLSGILNAYELFIQQKCAELFNKLFSILLIVLALLRGGDVRVLVIVNAISGVLTIILKLFFVKCHTAVQLKVRKFNKSVFAEVARFSVWVTVMSLAQRCIFNLAPSILGIVSNSTEIALFAPVNAMEGYFYSISAAVNGLFLATVSRYIAQKEEEKIYSLMVRVGRYQFIVMSLVFIEFACIGRDFMICWMGEEFVGAWPCALILFVPDILIFTEQIANTTVIAKNKVKKQAIGYIIMAVCCVGLSFPLSKLLGSLGACMAIGIGYTVLFVYMNRLYYKELQINVFGFYRECYLKLTLPMTAVAIVGYFICNHVITISSWIGIVVKGAVVLVLYFGVMFFSLNKEEKGMIKRLISSIRKV